MFDWTWKLLDLLGCFKQVHLIILFPNLVWKTTRPSLDLVEFVLLLVVPSLADIDFLAGV